MAWGTYASGIDDLVERLKRNDEKLTSLHILRFRRLDEQAIEKLCSSLSATQHLIELACSSHAISVDSAARFGAMIAVNTSLRSLSVGNSTLGDEALKQLCLGLEANQGLTYLDLENKGLSSAAGASIASVLAAHPSLRHLNLSGNSLGDDGLQAITGHWQCLSQLELGNCGISPQGVAALATGPAVNTLSKLDLSDNVLGASAGPAVAQLLGSATALSSLGLRGTDLGDGGVTALAAGLPVAACLTFLDLSSTSMTAAGAKALAKALPEVPCLRSLVLSLNPGVGDAGVQALADSWCLAGGVDGRGAAAVEQCDGDGAAAATSASGSGGLDLDFAACGVGAVGAAALAALPQLTQLSLMGCHIGEAGVAALLHTGPQLGGSPPAAADQVAFPRLLDLNLCACQLSQEQLRRVLVAAAKQTAMPCLEAVSVGGNPGVQEEGFEEMLEEVLHQGAMGRLQVHWRSGAQE